MVWERICGDIWLWKDDLPLLNEVLDRMPQSPTGVGRMTWALVEFTMSVSSVTSREYIGWGTRVKRTDASI